ncbi:MAG: hypothetical protein WCT23_08950 [Candidatus Neomarinimicrobiota bacterium]|jgi:nucleoside phosphorylase
MLIVSALNIEIMPLVMALKAEKIRTYSNKTALYRSEDHDILVVGVGPLMAERTLLSYLDEFTPDYILNTGTAGKMIEELEIGKVYQIATVMTDNEESIDLDLLLDEKGAACLSLRRPLTDAEQRDRSSRELGASLADMECYTIAKIAQDKHIPMSALKVISDFADCATREMFKQHIHEVSQTLCDELLLILDKV